MWFDSHCHLHLCEHAPLSDILARARDAAVTDMVTVGIDVASSRRAVEAAAHTGVYAAVGIHPNSASEWNDEAAETLEDLARSKAVVAIGETGLDFYRQGAPRDVQERVFREHIALAKAHDKALVIHTRDSAEAAADILADDGPPDRLVFHCWSADAGTLARALDLGAFVSFAGNVSFSKSDSLRQRATETPEERLLVETDSPFLAPEPRRGRPNEPAHVVLVGEALAAARAEDADVLAATTSANARRLFGLDR